MYTGWHTAYPDAWVRVIPESCREIPFEDNTLFFLCEFVDKAENICPRGVLRRVLDRAKKLGYEAYAAAEYEFFMFDESPESVREKGYRNLTPPLPRPAIGPSWCLAQGRAHGPGAAADSSRAG